MSDENTSKGGGWLFRLAVVGLLAAILLAITKPDSGKHADALIAKGRKTSVWKAAGAAFSSIKSDYRDYVLFSTLNDDEGVLSIGVLGMVFPLERNKPEEKK